MDPFFHTGLSISDSLKTVRKSVLIYETIILGITKAGNRHVRMLLTEASQCYARGQIGFKSKELKSRQAGNSPQVIAYADKANERLRRRYYKMVLGKSKKHNVAKTAIARELACFMWGMMTDRIA